MKRFKPHLEVLSDVQQWLYPQLLNLKKLGFVLYGETTVALYLGHRKCLDFEFFSPNSIDRKALREALPFLDETSLATQLQDHDNSQIFEISHPQLNNGAVKISFLGNIDFGHIGEPRLTEDRVLLVTSPLDIFAIKLKEIIRRPTTDNFVDIIHLINNGESLLKALGAASVLFGTDFSPMICLRALSYFDDLAPSLSKSDASLLVRQVSNSLISLNNQKLELPPLVSNNLYSEEAKDI